MRVSYKSITVGYQLTDVGALLLAAKKLGSFIMNKWEIIDHTFKFRVGDSDEKGGCTFIGGEWKDVTTNELFKGKKIVMFSLLVNFLHQLVRHLQLRLMTKCIINLKIKALMMFIVYQ